MMTPRLSSLSAGYLGAVTTEWGATQRLDNRYTWPRIRIKGAWTLDTFAGYFGSHSKTNLRSEEVLAGTDTIVIFPVYYT